MKMLDEICVNDPYMHSESDTNMEMTHPAPTRDARRAHTRYRATAHTRHSRHAETNKRGLNENVG